MKREYTSLAYLVCVYDLFASLQLGKFRHRQGVGFLGILYSVL